jgi:DNA-binding response OmpR family regulator
MKILVADDDLTSRRLLESILAKLHYETTLCVDGKQAWEILQDKDAPKLAILDWMMPEMDGVEVCRRLREIDTRNPVYIILLTALSKKEDIVKGLDAGANDYVIKPFNHNELQARINVGVRVVNLQEELSRHIEELNLSLQHIKTLQGILPICSYCKKIRDDKNYWQHVETYVSEHSGADFTHSICPECYETRVKPEIERISQRDKKGP